MMSRKELEILLPKQLEQMRQPFRDFDEENTKRIAEGRMFEEWLADEEME